ncbi:C40 family peptidase [Georgenia sp. AZ-5]|uniref:C40 family peptidase n=1 Tax=Georgenia sp. AZ-5 TaxID=3367526 RepID=UPI003754D33E
MSIGAAMGRIGEIEATIGRLSHTPAATQPEPVRAAAPAGLGSSGSLTSGTTASGDLFSRALSALGAAGAPAAALGTAGAQAAAAAAPPGAAAPAGAGAVLDDGRTSGADVVAGARKYLGVPYVWGGESLAEGGLDCSGLVQLVFSELGVTMPRVARQQMNEGQEIPSLAQARPGDLIVTRGGAHIGIYIGDNKMLHAPRPGEDVQIRELFETDATIDTIRRIVPADGAAAGSDLVGAAQAAAVTGAAR